MLAYDRHDQIIKLLNSNNFVKVSELSNLFQVSEETIRRDFDKLEKKGVLKKVHGGAVLNDDTSFVPPIIERKKINIAGKEKIGMKAAEMVKENETLLIDSGTTTYYMARFLPDINITVITYDIYIALELCNRKNIELIIAGGTQRKNSFSFVGAYTLKFLDSINVDKGFLSTSGIDYKNGLSVSNNSESYTKKKIIERSDKTICLADRNKFNKKALVTFADIEMIDTLICDSIPQEYLTIMKDKNVNIISTN